MDIRDVVEGTEVNHDDLSYHNYEKEDPYMETTPYTTMNQSKNIYYQKQEKKDHLSKALQDDAHSRILVPIRGNIYVQDGIDAPLRLIYDKYKSLHTTQYLNRLYDDAPSSPPPPPPNQNQNTAFNNQDNSQHPQENPTSIQNRTTGSAVGRDNGAIDPQLSPNGTMVAFVVAGEMYVVDTSPSTIATTTTTSSTSSIREQDKEEHRLDTDYESYKSQPSFSTTTTTNNNNNNHISFSTLPIPVRITFGAANVADDDINSDINTKNKSNNNAENDENPSCITHGLADFVAQEEMDRYRGFWWDLTSNGIVFTKVDETDVPPYRISHQGRDGTGASTFEDHRE